MDDYKWRPQGSKKKPNLDFRDERMHICLTATSTKSQKQVVKIQQDCEVVKMQSCSDCSSYCT